MTLVERHNLAFLGMIYSKTREDFMYYYSIASETPAKRAGASIWEYIILDKYRKNKANYYQRKKEQK